MFFSFLAYSSAGGPMAAEALKLRNLMSTASAACDANAAEQASSAAATALKHKWRFFMVSSPGCVVAESQRECPKDAIV
jgi:hypothetical protein